MGFQIAGLSIGLDPNGKNRGMTGATPFFEVDDIRETVAALKAAGAAIEEDVRPVGGGGLIALLPDPDGKMIGLGQSPWAVAFDSQVPMPDRGGPSNVPRMTCAGRGPVLPRRFGEPA